MNVFHGQKTTNAFALHRQWRNESRTENIGKPQKPDNLTMPAREPPLARPPIPAASDREIEQIAHSFFQTW